MQNHRLLTAGRGFCEKCPETQNGGPAMIRKNLADSWVVPFDQMNGIAGELVVKTALQSTKLVEDWI